jgi:hypothetical protein
MTDFKDIAILGLVALSISDKLGGLNLGGLFGSGTPADPRVEVKETESISCTCADGVRIQSDSGNCIQECDATGHGTKTEISTTHTEKITEIISQPIVTESITVRHVCPDGKVVDLTETSPENYSQRITDECGFDCPPPYEWIDNRCRLQPQTPVYRPPQERPQGAYEEISGGQSWMDAPELLGTTAPAFIQPEAPAYDPPSVSISVLGDDEY